MTISLRSGQHSGQFQPPNPVLVVPYPDNVAVGDIMWVFFDCLAGGNTCTTPTGWTKVVNGFDGNNVNLWAFAKVATSGDVVTAGSPSRSTTFTLDSEFTTDWVSAAWDGSGGAAIGTGTFNVKGVSGIVNDWQATGLTITNAGSTLIVWVGASSGSDQPLVDAAMTQRNVGTNPNPLLMDQTGVGSGATGTRGAGITGGNFVSATQAIMVSIEASGGGGGGTNTPMTLTATITQTTSRARGVGRPRSANEAQTASMVKGSGSLKTLTATITQTASRLRNPGKLLTKTHTQSTGAAPATAAAVTIATATQTQTPSRVRALAPVAKTATNAQTATRTRALSPIAKTATNAQTASLIKGQGFLKTLTATITQTASRARAIGIARAVTQVQTIVRALALARALLTTQSQLSAIAKALAKGSSATQTQTASLAKGAGHLLTFSATITQTPSRARAVQRLLSAIATQTLTRTRAMAKALAVVETQTPSSQQDQSGGGAHSLTLTATVVQTAALARAISRQLSATNAQTPSRLRQLARLFTATQTQTPTVSKGRGFFVTLAVVALQIATRVTNVGLTRFAAQTHALDVQQEVEGGVVVPVIVPASPAYCSALIDMRDELYQSARIDLRT